MSDKNTISEVVALANHFASRKQWTSAAAQYRFAIDRIVRSMARKAEDTVKVTREDLEKYEGKYTLLSSVKPKDAVVKLAGTSHYVTAFTVGRPHFWIIAVVDIETINLSHKKKDLGNTPHVGYQDENLRTISIPTAPPRACYLIDLRPKKKRIVTLLTSDPEKTSHPKKAARLAYCLSRLAWVQTSEMFGLYQIHQVTLGLAERPVMTSMGYYYHSLCLAPADPWALSHLAEGHRCLGNSWFGGTRIKPGEEGEERGKKKGKKFPHGGHDRIHHYIAALRLFDKALFYDPHHVWSNAHLGATIVNVRGFVGFKYIIEATSKQAPSSQCLFGDAYCPLLEELLYDWFYKTDLGPLEGSFDAATGYDAFNRFTGRAAECLIRAIQGVGQFYPWAQAYYSYVLLLSVLGRRHRVDKEGTRGEVPSLGKAESDTAVLALVSLADAYYMNPAMMSNSFEPGELYVNGFFQVSLFYSWSGDFHVGWTYARRGMGRLFNFYFLPGLDAMLGFQLLAIAAHGAIKNRPGTPPDQSDPGDLIPSDFGFSGIRIPPAPPQYPLLLIQFMKRIIRNVIKPCISRFVGEHGFPLTTKLRISLGQVTFILADFHRIYKTEFKPVSELDNERGRTKDDLDGQSKTAEVLGAKVEALSRELKHTKADPDVLEAETESVAHSTKILVDEIQILFDRTQKLLGDATKVTGPNSKQDDRMKSLSAKLRNLVSQLHNISIGPDLSKPLSELTDALAAAREILLGLLDEVKTIASIASTFATVEKLIAKTLWDIRSTLFPKPRRPGMKKEDYLELIYQIYADRESSDPSVPGDGDEALAYSDMNYSDLFAFMQSGNPSLTQECIIQKAIAVSISGGSAEVLE